MLSRVGGWLAGQLGPEKKRRQLVPDLRAAAFQYSGNSCPNSPGLSGLLQRGLAQPGTGINYPCPSCGWSGTILLGK